MMDNHPETDLYPIYLRCEYKENTMGVDTATPRLSWMLETESDKRGRRQSAYQILVSTNLEPLLDEDKGDLWDTGKVKSCETNQIVYEGKPPQSNQDCWWRVRVWDEKGKPGPWSEPAFWTTGLLNPKKEWKAEWIGYRQLVPRPGVAEELEDILSLSSCKWIRCKATAPESPETEWKHHFRLKFQVAENEKVLKAGVILRADDWFELFVNGEKFAENEKKPEGWKKTHIVKIQQALKSGENTVAILLGKGAGETPPSLNCKMALRYESGECLEILSDGAWKASGEAPEDWTKSTFDDSAWEGATVVGDTGFPPWCVTDESLEFHLPPAIYMRKDFTLSKEVARATLFATSLGIYEFRLNGERVEDNYFTPGWCDYKKRVYYNTYDVTDYIEDEDNTAGIILAEGWYCGHVGWGGIRNRYGTKPCASAQLVIEYEDGSTETIATDSSWKASHGAIREGDFLMGEVYDARLELEGWDEPKYDDSVWAPVELSEKPDIEISSYPGVPVRAIEELSPKGVSEPEPGVYVFDMGQNMVGFVRLQVKGAAGTSIRLRYAEMLNPDGTLYRTNLRGARATDTFVLKGDGEEIWEPRFTFHGFRYVEVVGYPGEPEEDAITGVVLHSEMAFNGEFECSEPMLEQLYENIVWGQRGNYLEVPTDCPQRDERLGWTGDAQVFIRTASYNMDVAAFYVKWLQDVFDAQREDGAFTDIAPDLGLGAGTPAWADAGIICPYTIYKVYGDKDIIKKYFDRMDKYIQYLKAHSENLLRPAVGYGDWLSIEAKTPKDVIGTAYFGYSTKLMIEMAEVIGEHEKGRQYRLLFNDIKKAFNEAYVSEDGQVKGGTQASYVLALYFGLIDDQRASLSMEHLIKDLESKNYHLSTGFVGLPILLMTLTQYGRNDLSHRLLLNDTFPSWGYEIKHGATTIWERWDGWTQEKGFQDPGMNSFNHYAFGAVGEWMFSRLVGIETEDAGFRRIRVRPNPDTKITQASAHYESINGEIICQWEKTENQMKMQVTVPANTVGVIHIPTSQPQSVQESGKDIKDVPGIECLGADSGYLILEVGSGDYQFTAVS